MQLHGDLLHAVAQNPDATNGLVYLGQLAGIALMLGLIFGGIALVSSRSDNHTLSKKRGETPPDYLRK